MALNNCVINLIAFIKKAFIYFIKKVVDVSI